MEKCIQLKQNLSLIRKYNGCALLGLIDIVKKSGATLEGAGIVIEKGFQHGGQEIRDMGIRLESLAIVDSMTDDSLTFRD